MSPMDVNALLASAAIVNAMVCAFSLMRRQPSVLAAGATAMAALTCAGLLAAHLG